MWIDNFNKKYSFRIPDIEKGTWTQCNWTGVALREYTASALDMRVQTVNGEVVPAMPSQAKLFARTNAIQTWFNQQACQGDDDMLRFDASWVMTWGVHNVPLKPQVADVPDEHKAAVGSKNLSLDTLHPLEIIDENIGANLGMAKIMRDIYDKAMALPLGQRKYIVLNVDSNIFYRVVKVLTQVFFC